MKFLRQFGAAVAVVAVVVLIGLAWSRLSPSLPGEARHGHEFIVRALPGGKLRALPGGKLPPGGRLPRLRIVRDNGSPDSFLGDLLKPVNLVVLRNNAFLEAVVMAAVVIADAGHRRLRRARRARTGLPR